MLECIHDLAVGKLRLLHVEILFEKFLLLTPVVFRGDYPRKWSMVAFDDTTKERIPFPPKYKQQRASSGRVFVLCLLLAA